MHGQISPRDAARLRGYAVITQGAIAATAVSAVLLLAALLWAFSLRGTRSLGDENTMLVIVILGGIGMVGIVLLSLTATITFLLWFHKAIANLHQAQLSGLRTRPLRAVLSLFVPVVQLFLPFFTMRELWNRSHGKNEHQSRDGVATVTVWWLCLLTGSFVIAFMFALATLFDASAVQAVAPGVIGIVLLLVGLCFQGVAAACLVVILRRITTAQASLLDGNAIFA